MLDHDVLVRQDSSLEKSAAHTLPDVSRLSRISLVQVVGVHFHS